MQWQREQGERLLADFALSVPSLCTRDESDQLMAGKLLLALELVRSLEQHDVSTPNGNLVDVLITGDILRVTSTHPFKSPGTPRLG